MIDLDMLKAYGTSNDRLKEIFTAVPCEEVDGQDDITSEEKRTKREEDIGIRKKFETLIRDRQMEAITFNLSNHKIFSAVDLAWDSRPIHPQTHSLMLYAEGRIDLGSCAKQLTDLKCADEFVTKDAKGAPIGINMPKFTDVTVNLVSSFVTRRLAAQSNKYNSLFPCYKYEPRGTSAVAKLRADVMSQVSDIMADAFDHRHQFVQIMRDMMLYSTSVSFVRKGWEREVQWEKVPIAEEFKVEGGKPPVRPVIVKEGVSFVNIHPSRVFWDNAYPLSSINTDTGCEYIGYWDVVRYRDVAQNPEYWNREGITFNSDITMLFNNYALYFSQYYCTIKVPGLSDWNTNNDLKSSVGYMASNEMDSAMIISIYNQKLVPKDHGIGDYPYPVWIRFMTAGDGTVIHAEILPSTPAVAAQFNCKDDRRLNKSIAHELMGYQDQLTNLQNYLLLCLSTDNFKVIVLDTDSINSPEALAAFRAKAKGKNYYNEPLVLEVSRSKMEGLGVDMKKVVELVETRNSAAIDVIFRAMLQLLNMVERLMALSPQEQGQPAPREISATETNLIAGTTESVYGFLSDSADEMRAAIKRIIYESYICYGNNDLRVPAIERYSKSVILKAGFDVVEADMEMPNDPAAPQRHTIIGTKQNLIHDYIFTSRDGAERAVNTQAANVLVQLLGVLQNPIIAAAVGKEKLFEVVNEIFRLSGAGVDLKLEVKEGEGDQMGADANAQMQQILSQITGQLEQQQKGMQTMGQQVQAVGQQVEQLTQSGKEFAKGVSDDVGKFKSDMATMVKDMDHAQELEIIALKTQMRDLMKQVLQLGRIEAKEAA